MKNVKKAMVMAAGVGSRLGVLTKTTPKPLVPVVNKPVMDILLEKLKYYGIDSVIANTHYLGKQIQKRYGENSPVDINFESIFENELSGTAGGVRKCKEFFEGEENFLVVSADGLHDADLGRIIASHIESGCIATMAVIGVEKDEVSHYGVVVPSNDYTVSEFQEKPSVEEAKSNCINTGIYVFNKKIFDYIPEGVKYDFAKNVFPSLLGAGEKINTYRICSYWSDIGTVEQYIQSNFDALAKKVMIFDAHIKRNLDARYVLGNNVKMDSSVKLFENCIVGNNCEISANAELKNVILWDNVKVGAGVKLENIVAAQGAVINCSVQNEIIEPSKVLETVNI